MKLLAILGISAFYHDSATALIINGEIIAAVLFIDGLFLMA